MVEYEKDENDNLVVVGRRKKKFTIEEIDGQIAKWTALKEQYDAL